MISKTKTYIWYDSTEPLLRSCKSMCDKNGQKTTGTLIGMSGETVGRFFSGRGRMELAKACVLIREATGVHESNVKAFAKRAAFEGLELDNDY